MTITRRVQNIDLPNPSPVKARTAPPLSWGRSPPRSLDRVVRHTPATQTEARRLLDSRRLPINANGIGRTVGEFLDRAPRHQNRREFGDVGAISRAVPFNYQCVFPDHIC